MADNAPEQNYEAENTQSNNFDAMLKNKALQSEFDRRVSKALETARAKSEQDFQRQLQQELALAKQQALDEAKAQAEQELAQREIAVSQKEKDIARRELRTFALEQLAKRALPAGLADALNYEDESSMQKSLEATERAFRQAIQQGMESHLAGLYPEAGNLPPRNEDLDDESYYRANYRKKHGGNS